MQLQSQKLENQLFASERILNIKGKQRSKDDT